MKTFDLSDKIKAMENARKQAEATAKSAADAEVARVSRVAKHVDRDDLDDVWQETYDRTLRLEMDVFEAELDALEEEEADKRRLSEYFADREMEQAAALRRLGLMPVDPTRICHECQSKPCRCAEFAGRRPAVFTEQDAMDMAMEDEDLSDQWDEFDYACSTCHNWPCVCYSRLDGF